MGANETRSRKASNSPRDIKDGIWTARKYLNGGRSLVYKCPQFPSNLLLITMASFPHILTIPAIVSFVRNSGDQVKSTKANYLQSCFALFRDYILQPRVQKQIRECI